MALLLGTPTLGGLIEVPPVPEVVAFSHGGGTGNLSQLAAEAVETFRRYGGAARVVVVLDSDDASVGQSSPNVQTVVAAIAARAPDARTHVHMQRAIENYLPRTYWEQVRARIPYHQGIVNLFAATEDDWDSFDFRAQSLKKIPPYNGADRDYHASAFARAISTLSFSERPTWAASLRARDRHCDLQALVTLIDSLR